MTNQDSSPTTLAELNYKISSFILKQNVKLFSSILYILLFIVFVDRKQ
jgi:hypothetical protein